jgi:glycosyltransferase involved in cell wall biosynthesis
VTFDVVGRHPTRAVRRLNRIGGVRVVGEVKDVRPFLVQADISVAPFRIARGLQNKILEAMAAGIPVVATSKATAGLLVKSEEEILVGDTPEEFARQVVRLIQDRALYERIAKKARSRVLESYDWKTVGSQLQMITQRFSSKTPETDPGPEKRSSL